MASDNGERPLFEADEVASADDTLVVETEHFTGASEEWPVAEFYRVEPAAPAVPEAAAHAGNGDTVILAQDTPIGPRRLARVDPGVLVAIGAVAAAAIVIAVLLGLRDGENTASARPATSDTVPVSVNTPPESASARSFPLVDVKGSSLEEARAVLEGGGLRVTVRRVASDRPRDEVLREKPNAGTQVSANSMVRLIVARGSPVRAAVAPQLRVPGVIGLPGSDAVIAIRDAGLVPRIRLVASTESAGRVIRQSPNANSDAARGSEVVLLVAKGRPLVHRTEVPDVVGMTADAAQQMLRAAGFAIRVITTHSNEPAGQVFRQTPAAGTDLRKGATIALHVSSGAARVDVPDVVGLDEESARLELENAGFTVRVVIEPTDDPTEDGIVVRQTPPGGSTAGPDSLVTLSVSRI
jgi:beta-lactam-binding protein with PASTA domain